MVLLVLVSVVLMTLDHRGPVVDPFRYALSSVVHPIRVAATLPLSLGESLIDAFRSRRELVAELEQLRARQLLYEVRLQKLDALEVEIIRLRELLDSSYEVGEPVLIAELMKVDLDPYTHLIQIDKGASDGAYIGQPVLAAGGVVGQVDEVGPFTAMVRLISDPSHAIPVQVNRNGVRSVAVGTGNLRQLELTSLPKNTDIRPGDLLVTSGLGGRFPPGYPVGTVDTVEVKPGRPFARVTIQPAAALARIQEVLLVRRREPAVRLAGEARPETGERQPVEGPGS